MQQCGEPPQEIVDELAPGMSFAGMPGGAGAGAGGSDNLPPELANCSIQ